MTSDQAFALLLLLVGFLIGGIPGIIHHVRVMKGHATAIRDITEEIRTDAQTYLIDKKMSPLYRTASNYFNRAFETLMYEGGLKPDELKALLRFGNQAEQFNRGLDQVQQYFAVGGKTLEIQQEFSRIRIKAFALVPHDVAEELADGKEQEYVEEVTRYDAVRPSIDGLISVSWIGWVRRYLGRRK